MSQKVKRRFAAIMAGFLAEVLLLSLILSLITPAFAANNSDEIAEEIYETNQAADALGEEAESLRQQAADRREEALAYVEKKLVIDQAVLSVEEDIDQIRAQLQQLNLDIADKQDQVDAALEAEADMAERYKTRLRAMEENGAENYWAVIFQATSLSDLLDRLNMIAEISRADQMMQEQLAQLQTYLDGVKDRNEEAFQDNILYAMCGQMQEVLDQLKQE